MLLSLYVLFAPDPGGPEVAVPHLDKAVHLLLFALLAVTARWRFGRRPAVVAALVGYAVGSELVQAGLLQDRSGDAVDVLADLTGAALGLLATRPGGRDRRHHADRTP